MLRKQQQAGFTIIELVVVIVIIGILAAVALPRFLGLQDRAHDAIVEGTQAAFASGVLMANALWMSHAKETSLDNLMERKIEVLANQDESDPACAIVWPYAADPQEPVYLKLNASIDGNADGYPVGHSIFGDGPSDRCGITNDADAENAIPDDDVVGDQACHEVFEFLLSQQSVKSFPLGTVARAAFAADHLEFVAEASGNNECTYTYTPDKSPNDVERVITYDAETGRVKVTGLTTADFSK